MAKEKAAKIQGKTSGKEKLSYGLYFVGQNIFYIFLYLYLSTYFTDIGLSAYVVSIMVLVVKGWDAINDPIFGGIVDRVRFKKGKFLPWLRLSLIAIPIATILLFAIPSTLSTTAKVIWAVLAYMLWDTAYTICDVPIFGLVTTMTDVQQERTTIMSIGRIAAMLAAAVVAILVPSVRSAIGGWLPMTLVLSVVALITMVPICITAKERVEPPAAEKEVGLREMFRYLGQNKYILIFYAGVVVYNATAIGNTLGIYFARYCLGDESVFSILAAVGILPAIVMGVFIPSLARRFDKFTLYFFALCMTIVLGVVQYFVGYQNFTLFLSITVLRGIPLGMISVLQFQFTPDCAEYGLFKTGINASGIAFSIQTFSVKFTAALATSLGTLVLGIIGFVSYEGATQAAGFNDKLWFVYTIVPVVGALLALPIFSRYKLRDKTVQVMAKANAGEISHEEADRLLEGKI